MPLQATSGAASYDAFGGGVAAVPNYIEDVFSTYLYTGTGTADNKITNNIDLSTKGGMVWLKSRSGAYNNYLTTNATATSSGGGTTWLYSNTTDALLGATGTGVCNFFTDGFDINPTGVGINGSGQNYASWTFRKQPKFFDVVTWTGDGTATRQIPHNLGSTPGCFISKRTNEAANWVVWHRSTSNFGGILNSTAGFIYGPFASTPVTATTIEVGLDIGFGLNFEGVTYVAYLFAHDAGGFGLTGTDNVISCGSYTGDDSDNGSKQVNLGFEPQWVLIKSRTDAQNWFLVDNMRGMTTNGSCNHLRPNLSGEEQELALIAPTATGFNLRNAAINTSGSTYIYIAIRRGPMKVPTDATKVFAPYQVPASPTTGAITGFVTDMGFIGARSGSDKYYWGSRLTGNNTMNSASTDAETANTNQIWDRMNGWWNTAINNYMTWGFARAPGYFDAVCYSGTGSATTKSHNLGVVPELMIVKSRSQVNNWAVYLGGPLGGTKTANLNQTYAAYDSSGHWNNTQPTASVFSIGNNGEVNDSGVTYVNYLFATCAGVSKVGSYTGTGTTLQVDCGFTGGARFVLIKRTDATGAWYVWDTARGIVSGNDPYLLLNSTAAEVTNTDYVDTYSAGFEISSTAPDAINASGGTFIFLAIA